MNRFGKWIAHLLECKSIWGTLFPGYSSRSHLPPNFIHPLNVILFRNQRTFFADDIYSRLNDVAAEMDILPNGLTVNSIAGPWTNRDRVPLVTVIREYETQTITLSQVCIPKYTLRIRNLTEQKRCSPPQGREKPNDSMIFPWIMHQ